jgi:broad specificity phosphatase PhoE
MLLYLRHGDDRGDDVYRHDRRLNDRGRKKAGKEAKRLIEKYGHPDTVFVSPFRRAIETLNCMSEHFSRPVDVNHDRRIAQYLSDKQRAAPSLSPKTLEVITINEDGETFRRRILDHVKDVQRRAKEGATIWGITHQVVIEEVAQQFGVKISGTLDFLDHVVMLR